MKTPEQQLANVRLAIKLWQERVKPEEVVHNLSMWHCGTQACFGGWLSTWPEFRAQGVSCGSEGEPVMLMSGCISPALELFGVYYGLFTRRTRAGPIFPNAMERIDIANPSVSDHEIVLLRLRAAEQHLLEKAECSKS